ncbi:uncharacterized protein LOC103574191 [Microplitis demolitor]|uniref:uncharacterized protein LOC103574191 n=1 Tax=Microplitis demolitor TaxID=69319 RepID=UPI00235B6035|nr:uncharacterized protein LOC103574191 [Microplitis demolitor]
MSGKKSESSESKKMKKIDKTPSVVSHREYLDMDTDEEEFGHQETPEPDEELPPEPEKPAFTEEQLQILLQYVKNLTAKPHGEIIFSQKNVDIIYEYFCNPSHTILTIFYTDFEWKVFLNFPPYPKNGLTYFLRSPWQVYTPDNFMSTVKFGSLNYFENSLLKFFQNIYAPVAFAHDRWPIVKRDEIFSNINKLISHLNDATYYPMGLTILYVPREKIFCSEKKMINYTHGYKEDTKENNNNLLESNMREQDKSGLIERLERVARYWVKQIRQVLRGSNIPTTSACRSIIDEINFWNYRYDIDDYTTKILYLIRFVAINSKFYNSPYVQKKIVIYFLLLKLKIRFENYLNLSTTLTDKNINVYYIFFLKFELNNSLKRLQITDKIEILCRALGTQIINQCKKYISLDIILDEDPLSGKQMLQHSVYSCQRFKEIFDQLIIMDRHCNSSTLCNINKNNIFNHIDTFIQRCQDLIEVTNTRIIFDKCEDIKVIGGAKATEHELKYKKIEKLFSKTLEEIKKKPECILDVTEFTWLEKIKLFRNKVEDIDNMMKNLIHDIFENVSTIEEALEALYAIKRFMIRKNLQETLDNYWTNIWKKFNDELELIITDIDDEILLHDRSMTSYAGAATLLHLKNNYLSTQFNMLINASDWFDDNIAQE